MRKDEIKQVALSTFSKKGFNAATMQEIAEKVGLNKATLYFYFKSKQDLYLTILEEQLRVYHSALEHALQSISALPFETLLYKIVTVFVESSTHERLLLWRKTQLFSLSEDEENEDFRLRCKEILQFNSRQLIDLVTTLLRAQNPGIQKDAMDRFITSYHLFILSVLEWMLLSGYYSKESIQEILPQVWNNFWSGSRLAP